MKVESLQENLNKALTTAVRIISTKPQLPILSNILISVSNGACTITSSNVESSLVIPFGGKIIEEGEVLVPARTLQELVSSLGKEKIVLESKESSLIVNQLKFQAKITCFPAGDFPKVDESEGGVVWQPSLKAFEEALTETIYSSAVDEARAILNGVLFRFKDKSTLVSTDGFRLSKYTLDGDLPKASVDQMVIPSRSLLEVIKLVGDSEKDNLLIKLTPSQVSFEIGNVKFKTQTIAGNFPEFEKIIPPDFSLKIKLETEEFQKAIKTASIFARENANIIRLILQGKTLKIKSQGGEVGENESELDAEVEKGTDEEFGISFNFRYILDFLANLKDEKEIYLEFGTPTSASIFRPVKKQNYFHIIMPVRVQS